MSRADSGILFRAESPEPPNDSTHTETRETRESVLPASKGEEETTVGGKVVSLSNGSSAEGEDIEKLKAIPEEAFGVGAEQGKHLADWIEVSISAVGLRLEPAIAETEASAQEEHILEEGESNEEEEEEEEEQQKEIVTVTSEVASRDEEGSVHNLSENPETGQSEVMSNTSQSEVTRQELLTQVTSTRGDHKQELEQTEEDPVSSTVTVQLEEVKGLLEVFHLTSLRYVNVYEFTVEYRNGSEQ